MVHTQPRLSPCRLPWAGQWASNNEGTPMRSNCANSSGTSSTRSVCMVGCSLMERAYPIFRILSRFKRTASGMLRLRHAQISQQLVEVQSQLVEVEARLQQIER